MLERLVQKRMRAADAGIADHDVEPAEFFERARDERHDVARIAHVGALRERAAPARGKLFTRRLGTLEIDVRNNYRGPVGPEPLGDREPEPGRGSGDDRDLAGEIRQPGRPS